MSDAEGYKAYVAAAAIAFQKYGARMLARGGQYEQVEGRARPRNVVIEFPTLEAAQECYHSPEYQAALKLRVPVSTIDLVIIEGYDGPQP